MKKQTCIYTILILLILSASVDAITINNTVLNSTGLHTEINVNYPWTASKITVDSNYIYLGGLKNSNPLSISSERLSFNLTEPNMLYTSYDFPYYSVSNDIAKEITSPFNKELRGGSANITVKNCNIYSIGYSSTQHLWDTTLDSDNFSCSGTTANIKNIPYLDYPSTYLQINYNFSIVPCNLDYIGEFVLLSNMTDKGIAYTTPHTLYKLKNLSFKDYFLAPDVTDIHPYVGRGAGVAWLNNPGSGRNGQCYYNFTYLDGTSQRSANFLVSGSGYQHHNYTNPDVTKEVWDVSIWCNVTHIGSEAIHILNDTLVGNVTYAEDGGNLTLEFNIFNEDNITERQYSDVELFLQYWVNPLYINNISYSWTNVTQGGVCISPDNESISANLYLKHHTDAGFTHRYYIEDATLTANPLNVSLYNVNSTTDYNTLKITTRHKDTYLPFINVLAYLQRYYPGSNQWLTVQMDKSGDTGLELFDIKQKVTDYRLLFTDSANRELNRTQVLKFICDPSTNLCELAMLLPEYTGPTYSNGFNTWFTYSNSTKMLKTYWMDSNATTGSVKVIINRETPTGKITICNTTYLLYHGSDSCNLTGYTGEVFLNIYADGKSIFTTWINVGKSAIYQFIDKSESAFWTLGILAIIVCIGLFSPAGALIALMMGLIFTYVSGIFKPLNITILIVSCVLAVAIGMRLRK